MSMRLVTALLALALFIVPIFVVAPGFAQVNISDDVCQPTPGTGEKPSICADIEAGEKTNVIYGKDGILTRVISLLSMAIGVIAVIVLIISGIQMSLTQGEPSKISKTRSQIIYAVVGLVVAVAAQAVVQLILNRIGVS